ncbi:putative molybdenum carrier protein [Hydrogenophaga defluvii]|uniref:Molybdenum carrier protein n=1 Tax=Hydrogenophaga defluvii TaxID=249410 RepID=A0ABW2S7C6_9BURK
MADADLWLIEKIVSGGQTGVDRAALHWALQRGVAHGGWCPKGRLAADGSLPEHYLLRETDSTGYRQRTKLNVRDSDATLIFNTGVLDGGTLQTARFAQTLGRPHLVAQLDELALEGFVRRIRVWLTEGQFGVLNVAGPREEKRPGVYACVAAQLDACFRGNTAADADN